MRVSRLNADIETAYEVNVYGRKSGEDFATWNRKFELKSRPTKFYSRQKNTPPTINKQDHSDNPDWKLLLLKGHEEVLNLDATQLFGILGVSLLLIGVFAPVISLPVVGTLSYFRDGSIEGIAVILMAIAAIFCLFKRQYSLIYGPGSGALLLVTVSFFYYQNRINTIRSEMDRELSGNPFRGLGDLAIGSIQLQWGWSFLVVGSVLILVAAYFKQRKLNKQAFASIGVTLVGIAALIIYQVNAEPIPSYATEARNSEAKTYVGSINMGQLAYFAEFSRFAPSIDELGIGIGSETDDYQYQIVTDEADMTVVTATAKHRRLQSYTGGVFIVEGLFKTGLTHFVRRPVVLGRFARASPAQNVLNCVSHVRELFAKAIDLPSHLLPPLFLLSMVNLSA